jgi:hypothetical protein
MLAGPRSLALVLFLAGTIGPGCTITPAGTGTYVVPQQDAAPADGPSPPAITPDTAPDLVAVDAARPDLALDTTTGDTPRADGAADGVPASGWTGPPVIVGVGQGGRRTVSRDGVTWTTMDLGGADVTKSFAGVAYGNGLVVAVGGGCTGTTCIGRISSFNGDKWTDAALPAGQSWLAGVAYGKGVWVAVGASGPTLVSSDGKRWIQKGPIANNLRAVAFGDVGGSSTFVTTGDRSLSWRSVDGQTWTSMGALFPNDDPPVSLHTIVIGNGVVVAAGERGRRIRSVNAMEWMSAAGGGNDLPSVIYADHMFFAYADNGLAWISANDAQTWELVVVIEPPNQAFATGVLGDSRLFVGASGATIKTSTDGRGWTTRVTSADTNGYAAFTFAGL